MNVDFLIKKNLKYYVECLIVDQQRKSKITKYLLINILPELLRIILDYNFLDTIVLFNEWRIEKLKNLILSCKQPIIIRVDARILIPPFIKNSLICISDSSLLPSLLGSNTLLIIGWNQFGIICKNSWGINWIDGDNGQCTISYDILFNRLYVRDWKCL